MIQKLEKLFNTSVLRSAMKQFGDVSLEMFLLFSLMGIGIVLLITLLLWLRKKTIISTDIMTGVILAMYASIVIQLTLICRESGDRIGFDMDLLHGLVGGNSYYHQLMWTYLVLNVLMFIPFGFVIPMFSVVNHKNAGIQFLTVTLLSFMASMSIELAQIITQRGIYEVQDLASNTLGGVLGWLLFSIFFHMGRRLFGRKKEEETC